MRFAVLANLRTTTWQWSRKLFWHSMLSAGFAIIICAIVISLFRAMTPLINSRHAQIIDWISRLIAQPIIVDSLAAGWRGLEPTLVLKEITLVDPRTNQPLLKVDNFELGINLWRSLLKRHVAADNIFLDGARINVIQKSPTEIIVEGLNGKDFFNINLNEPQNTALLQKLFAVKKILLRNITVMWHSADGKIIPLRNVTVGFKNNNLWHDMWGGVSVNQETPSQLYWTMHAKSRNLHEIPDKGNLYFKTDGLLPEQWLGEKIIKGLQINNGNLSGEFWLDWCDNKIQKIQTNINLQHIILANPELHRSIFMPEARGNFLLKRNNDQSFTFIGDKIQLATQHLRMPETNLYGKLSADLTKLDYFYIKNFSLKLLTEIANLYANDQDLQNKNILKTNNSWQKLITQLRPDGYLENLSFDQTQKNADFKFATNFNQLKINGLGQFPQIDRLNGALNMNSHGGQINIDGADTTINLTKYYSHPLKLNQLTTKIDFQKEKTAWVFKLTNAIVAHPDFYLNGSAAVSIPFSGTNPYLSLLMSGEVKAKHLSQVLPDKLLDGRLLQWLKKSVQGDGYFTPSIIVNGSLADFPYENNLGTFLVETGFKDLKLKYHPLWPTLENIQGNIIFKGQTINVAINSGKIDNIPIQKITGLIPTVSKKIKSQLYVTGIAQSDLTKGLSLLHKAPLSKKLKDSFAAMQGEGSVYLSMNLKIALEEPSVPTLFSGNLQLMQNKLALTDWDLNFDKIQGQLNFNNDAISGHNLHGELFGQPIIVDVLPQEKQTLIKAKGKITAHNIRQYINTSYLNCVDGVTTYDASLDIPTDSNQQTQFHLTTNLLGLTFKSKNPLQNFIQQQMPFTFKMKFNDESPLNVTFNYGADFNGVFNLLRENKILTLQRGEIIFGKNQAVIPKEDGLNIKGELSHFNLNDWQPLFANAVTNSAGQQNSFAKKLKSIDLLLQQIDIYKMRLNKVKIKLKPQNEYWLVNLSGSTISGELHLPYNSNTIDAQLDYVNVAENSEIQNKSFAASFDPKNLPAINLTINSLHVGDKNYGETELIMSPSSNGVQIQKLLTKTKNYTVQAIGNWSATTGVEKVSLQGELFSNNLHGMFTDWNITPFLDGKKAQLLFNLDWQGSLFQPKLMQMQGKVDFHLHHGRIIDIGRKAEQELGFGEILTFLSLQSLPRRLSLDFTDLVKGGYSFESLSGNLILKKGLLKTQNTYLKGIAADMAILGYSDLSKKDLDLILTVTPHMTSSLPVIAAIAGGPVVGAATWMVNALLGGAVDKMTARSYQITGQLQQPKINPIFKTQFKNKLHQENTG